MAGGSASTDLLNQLAILTTLGAVGDLSDAQLLRRFLAGPDADSQAALTALVARHGPMVLNACRRVLGDSHDAQDAFQSTFLVLARKAGSIRKADSVAGWLHGVALRVAARVKADAARRRAFERRGSATKALESATERDSPESWPELHEEIARLPERYREPVVMCYLEGLTTEAVARRLGCPRGTVLSRLARGRERLRARLTRRGLALPAALLTATTQAGLARAALPAALFDATLRVCLSFTGGQPSGAVPTTATTLAMGVISAMMISKLKTLGVVGGLLAGLVLGTALAAVFSATPPAMAQAQPPPAMQRYQIATWVHSAGAMPASHGAYILDTQTGQVWHVEKETKPKPLGGVE
jgi:RNA polymerase sigma factor (sigma-70 family)